MVSALTFQVNGSVIMWGSFVNAAVVFVLTALAVFVFIVKPYNVLRDPGCLEVPSCLTERD